MTDETNMIENTLYVVYNEDGDMTADTDRDEAIERMNDTYGGEQVRVVEIRVEVPRPKDLQASITLPAGTEPEPIVQVQS